MDEMEALQAQEAEIKRKRGDLNDYVRVIELQADWYTKRGKLKEASIVLKRAIVLVPSDTIRFAGLRRRIFSLADASTIDRAPVAIVETTQQREGTIAPSGLRGGEFNAVVIVENEGNRSISLPLKLLAKESASKLEDMCKFSPNIPLMEMFKTAMKDITLPKPGKFEDMDKCSRNIQVPEMFKTDMKDITLPKPGKLEDMGKLSPNIQLTINQLQGMLVTFEIGDIDEIPNYMKDTDKPWMRLVVYSSLDMEKESFAEKSNNSYAEQADGCNACLQMSASQIENRMMKNNSLSAV